MTEEYYWELGGYDPEIRYYGASREKRVESGLRKAVHTFHVVFRKGM